MNHDTLIRHLTYYADLMIKDLREPHARSYLRGCITIWREHYGEDLAREMGLIIAMRFKDCANDAA